SLISGLSRNARDTVEGETPSFCATWRNETRFSSAIRLLSEWIAASIRSRADRLETPFYPGDIRTFTTRIGGKPLRSLGHIVSQKPGESRFSTHKMREKCCVLLRCDPNPSHLTGLQLGRVFNEDPAINVYTHLQAGHGPT